MKKTSKEQKVDGTLIMAANSLGLEEDIPTRALASLHSSELLIFEEDRPARQVLKKAKLRRSYLKFNEHGQEETLQALSEALKKGQTAVYMSDQGSPCLADPGRPLLSLAYKLGARVLSIPGPSAITAALSSCPFDLKEFFYAGFLPRTPSEREKKLKKLAAMRVPLILLDTPYRLLDLVTSCEQVLQHRYRGFLALDISGEQESYFWGSLSSLRKKAEEIHKLNFVLILDPVE
ncbi:MAG: hypothetical protein KA436_01160 [Oligoflexales bacterium]|nr:hypothetical protein [Oligoflexales bacterium]